MSDDTPSVTDLAHERGADGDLLPVTKTVEVRGEGEADVEVRPATAGQRNEWKRKLQDGDEELADDVRDDLFDEFLAYDPADFGGAESWDGIRPALEDALANAIFSELFDTDDFEARVREAIEERSGNAETAD